MRNYQIYDQKDIETSIVERIKTDFPGTELKIDAELLLYDKFLNLLKDGIKITTVRYGGGKIRVPESNVLPLFESRENDRDYKEFIDPIRINNITVKSIGELTEKDGINDGFSSKRELVDVIKGIYEPIYGKVGSEDLVSIYAVSLDLSNPRSFD